MVFDKAKLTIEVVTFPSEDVRVPILKLGSFYDCCSRGDPATPTVVERDKITVEDVTRYKAYALRECVSNGHLTLAGWLTERFDLANGACDDEAALMLTQCLEIGQTQYALWILSHFAVGVDALRACCAKGSLSLARWLMGHADIAAPPLRTGRRFYPWLRPLPGDAGYTEEQNEEDREKSLAAVVAGWAVEAFEACCAGGQLEVARWLATEYEIPPSKAFCDETLGKAVDAEHPEFVKWLLERFGARMGEERARCVRDAMRVMARFEIQDETVARIIVEYFHLVPADLRPEFSERFIADFFCASRNTPLPYSRKLLSREDELDRRRGIALTGERRAAVLSAEEAEGSGDEETEGSSDEQIPVAH